MFIFRLSMITGSQLPELLSGRAIVSEPRCMSSVPGATKAPGFISRCGAKTRVWKERQSNTAVFVESELVDLANVTVRALDLITARSIDYSIDYKFNTSISENFPEISGNLSKSLQVITATIFNRIRWYLWIGAKNRLFFLNIPHKVKA